MYRKTLVVSNGDTKSKILCTSILRIREGCATWFDIVCFALGAFGDVTSFENIAQLVVDAYEW